MFPQNPSNIHLESFALSYLQPESALSTDDLDSPSDHEARASALNAPPAAYPIAERIRRPSATHSLAGSSRSKADTIPGVVTSHTNLTPSSTSILRARAVPPEALELSPEDQLRQRRIALLHFITICCALFGEGWNDGSNGPLLPAFQRHYDVRLYFHAIASVTQVRIDRISRGLHILRLELCGTCFQLTAYVIQAPAPPFPVMVFANFITGLGLSLLNMETKLGIMHACYGQRHWSFHYLVSGGLTIFNIIALTLVFRFKHSKAKELLEASGQARQETGNQAPIRDNVYRQVFGLSAVHILTAFAVIYIGVEVTLGGWIVTFIINERGGGHSSGYISSGFFGGLTLGRVGLLWLNKLVGEHLVITLYTAVAIVLEITIWFVPSIIENAVAVSMIGLVLGPMFPVMVSHASKTLPRWLMTVSIGWITGIGMMGSAILPFLTGLLSSRFGIKSLQPLYESIAFCSYKQLTISSRMISMMATLLCVWFFVPKSARRVD
ncbi:hypothetical protein H0H92_002726 [Tricholoma furcatifolium]|nr:hypothetical protein H0H92_002726 [Tricholoma furcatifolium]